MPEPAGEVPDRGARRLLWVALALASLLLLTGLHATLWGSEARWLVVARGMARSGDPFAMTLGGETYADKPFGSYWLIVLAAKLLGGFTEAAGRLPGVLAYLATLVTTFALGCRTLGSRTGALAALLLASSARLLFLADTASADPQQLFGLTLAMLLLLEIGERGRLRDFVLLGLVCGLTTQMKGLPALALPAFAALLWTALAGRWGRLSAAGVALAVLLGAGLALLPFVVAHAVHGDWEALALLWRESVVRAVDPFDHVEPWWFYLVNQFELLAAWSPLLPAGLLWAWLRLTRGAGAEGGANRSAPGGTASEPQCGSVARLRKSESARRAAFPVFGYLVVLLFFSLSASRRSYYLMPIAPFAALLVADVLLAASGGAVALARRIGLGLIGALGLATGLLSLGIGALRLWSPVPPAALAEWQPTLARLWPALPPWLAATGVVVVPAAVLLRATPASRTLVGCLAAVLVQIVLLAMTIVIDLRVDLDPLPRFIAAVRAYVPPGEIASVNEACSARVRFYLDPASEVPAAAARFRIAATRLVPSTLAAEPEWSVAHSPLLDAASWPADDSESLLLLERRPAP